MSKAIALAFAADAAVQRAGACSGGTAERSALGPPWLDRSFPPEARAQAALAAMTLDEKLRLVFGYSDQALTDLAKVPDDIVSADLKTYVVTHQVKGSAGFVPGVPRLGNSRPDADRRIDRRSQQLHSEHRAAVLACDRRELRSRGPAMPAAR